jgi:hypothetical protein
MLATCDECGLMSLAFQYCSFTRGKIFASSHYLRRIETNKAHTHHHYRRSCHQVSLSLVFEPATLLEPATLTSSLQPPTESSQRLGYPDSSEKHCRARTLTKHLLSNTHLPPSPQQGCKAPYGSSDSMMTRRGMGHLLNKDVNG